MTIREISRRKYILDRSMIYITKRKTLGANTLNEGAVGEIGFNFVKALGTKEIGGYTISIHLQSK